MNAAWQRREGEDREGGFPKEARETLEEVVSAPDEEARARPVTLRGLALPVEQAGWSGHRPVGPRPYKFHLNQRHGGAPVTFSSIYSCGLEYHDHL